MKIDNEDPAYGFTMLDLLGVDYKSASFISGRVLEEARDFIDAFILQRDILSTCMAEFALFVHYLRKGKKK